MSYWAIWLVIVILLTIMEAATVNLVSIWFIASGIVSLFVSLFLDSFFVQFGIFVLLGIVLLFLTRPMLLKMIESKDHKTNLDRIIGMEGIVTFQIKKNVIGEVKVDGKLWSAISDTTISEGSQVKVVAIESVKLVVEKIETEEEKKEEISSPLVKEEGEIEGKTPKKTSSTPKKKTTSSKPKKASTKSGSKTSAKKSSTKSSPSNKKKASEK